MLVKEEISKIREATKILMDKKFDEIKTNEQMREFLQSQVKQVFILVKNANK